MLQTLTKKKEEIYLLTSKCEIIENEAKIWLYDFENIKFLTDIKVEYVLKTRIDLRVWTVGKSFKM